MVEIDTSSFTTPEQVMPLPRGKDGKAIRIGDVVYGEDGRKWLVRGIHYGETKRNDPVHQVHAVDEQRHWRGLKPEWLSHERPDSWEKLEEDMMRGTSCRYFGCVEFASDCLDCPHGLDQTGVLCWKNERIDILKRAKKLAGMEEGERSDRLERIADELKDWSEDNRANGSNDVFTRAADLADRIRKLAKEEARDGD